ncbi:MAG TPA: pitrilysin family protein [Thermoanaerobaculia bacterium]|jgi:zinc protease|nr:pitrilysin family protein [Thermoanaerobaculia bacterium]
MSASRILTAVCAVSLAAVLTGAAPKKTVRKATTKTTVATRSSDVMPFRAVEKSLPNGLKVIVVPTGFPNIVSLQIPVQTGSRNEVEPGKSGFAHFFEHMMFRGTKAYPPDKYNAIVTQAGARQNAYTTDDYTNYHTTFAKDDLETILKIEADRFKSLDYSPEGFKTESRAVLGEYNKNSANPIVKIEEIQHDKAFTTHTYKHTTMGLLKDIEDMPNQFEYSKTFFDRWYRPEYATVIVAGDVDPQRTIALVEKYWGDWKPGHYKVDIPKEPEPKSAVYAHVPWPSQTLPWVTVAFHGPAFSESEKDFAALDMLMDLSFGETSDTYKRLVVQDQKVDGMFTDNPGNADPSLTGVYARLKKMDDALSVRDELLKTFAEARSRPVDAKRLADAKSNARYGLVRSLDNTERIAATLARYVRYRRSYDTLNNVFRVYESLTPEDLLAAARRYFTDNGLVVTTLAKDPMPAAVQTLPSLPAVAPQTAAAEKVDLPVVLQKTALPQTNFKLLFAVGSAHDPAGKEGLAALSAAMVAEAGSKEMRIDEISKALYPIAGSFAAQVDKEMTTFTGSIHRDNWKAFLDVVLPQLLEPGLREDDFQRLKDAQSNALKEDLRSNNEEELGKERLQTNLFAGTPYGHPVVGTVAGIESITLDDVRKFLASAYSRANLTLGVAGDVPDEMLARLKQGVAKLPSGEQPAAPRVAARAPSGLEVEIVEKETRATAISFGHPIEVTRAHPDFAALNVARAWLGEHRSSVSHLYKRIRETRGMNYGDYAYIEAFPRGMFQFFPDPNIARRAQIFEVWIRPVVPDNAQMALRIAINELDNLVRNGMSKEDFERTRDYLTKNVYVMTATQNQQLGYALDSRWYGIGEFTSYMRDRLAKLTVDDVNQTIRKHLSPKNLSVVIVTKDAKGLKDKLVADAFSPISYDAEKPADLLAEDKVIGALKLGIPAAKVRITPVEEVFAK